MTRSKIVWKQSILIYIGIVSFFFVMKIFGLDDIVQLRALNFIFVFFGINKAIKLNIINNGEVDYLSNFSLAILTAVTALIMVILSLVIYLDFIDPGFLEVMEQVRVWGAQINVLMVAFGIAVEGFASSVIISFILMQYWKRRSIDLIPQ
jgi:hypothetical protein